VYDFNNDDDDDDDGGDAVIKDVHSAFSPDKTALKYCSTLHRRSPFLLAATLVRESYLRGCCWLRVTEDCPAH